MESKRIHPTRHSHIRPNHKRKQRNRTRLQTNRQNTGRKKHRRQRNKTNDERNNSRRKRRLLRSLLKTPLPLTKSLKLLTSNHQITSRPNKIKASAPPRLQLSPKP